MQLIGFSVEAKSNGSVHINKEIIQVEKETAKQFKVNGSREVFGFRSIIDKSELDVIRDDDYTTSIKRTIWLVDNNVNETDTVAMLKEVVRKEIQSRMDKLNSWLEKM